MSRITRLTCENCGKVEDQFEDSFKGFPMFEFYHPEFKNEQCGGDFCCLKCLRDFITKSIG